MLSPTGARRRQGCVGRVRGTACTLDARHRLGCATSYTTPTRPIRGIGVTAADAGTSRTLGGACRGVAGRAGDWTQEHEPRPPASNLGHAVVMTQGQSTSGSRLVRVMTVFGRREPALSASG